MKSALERSLGAAHLAVRRLHGEQMIDWEVAEDSWQSGRCIVDTDLDPEGLGLMEGMDDERATVTVVLLREEWVGMTPAAGDLFRLLDYGETEDDDRTFEVVPNGVTDTLVDWRVTGTEVNE